MDRFHTKQIIRQQGQSDMSWVFSLLCLTKTKRKDSIEPHQHDGAVKTIVQILIEHPKVLNILLFSESVRMYSMYLRCFLMLGIAAEPSNQFQAYVV